MSLRDDYIAAISSMTSVSEDFLEFEEHVRASMDFEPLAHGPVEDDGTRSGCILTVQELNELLGTRKDALAQHVLEDHGTRAVVYWRLRIGGR